MTYIAFLITTRYQVYHYAAIAKHLPSATFVIEVRDHDFEVSEEFVREHIPNATTRLVPKSALRSMDGQYDVIVCQTPVLPQVLFDETMVVAQQYSLAKETYQYGIDTAPVGEHDDRAREPRSATHDVRTPRFR